MDTAKKLYKISAGLTTGYFLLACFFSAVPGIPAALASRFVPMMDFSDKLPVKLTLLNIAIYSPGMLFAAMALISLSASHESAKIRLCLSGVFVIASVVLTRVLSSVAGYAASGIGTDCIVLMTVISTVTNIFSVINTAGMIVLFCAHSIETYEYTRSKGIQGS